MIEIYLTNSDIKNKIDNLSYLNKLYPSYTSKLHDSNSENRSSMPVYSKATGDYSSNKSAGSTSGNGYLLGQKNAPIR